MIRRLNYTRRRPLTRKQVTIMLDGDDDPPAFAMQLDLGDARFPADAPIIVEARRQTSFMRWDFGTVGNRLTPSDGARRLTEFGSGEGVTFRLKIVEPPSEAQDGRPARILAHADHIRPRAKGERKNRSESLLHVDWGTDNVFRHQPWRMEFDESNDPLLRVSQYLISDKDGFVGSHSFTSIALPEIFRSVLTRILLLDKDRGDEGGTDWRSLWLKFASSLSGVAEAPPEDDDIDDWIERAVAAFCRHNNMRRRFERWWEGEE